MEKRQNYLHGAAILTTGVIIMKILGAIYKIPIANILGDEGNAMFTSAYSVYSVFLALATAGLPVALSRMVSEANTQGRKLQTGRIFSVAFWTFFVLGGVSTFVMLFFPEWLAGLLHNPDAALSIKVLAPSVILVCLTSAYRGFIQGHENMIPTTVGQILEVLAKVVVGLALAWIFARSGAEKSVSSAGAIFGVTVGSLVVLVYMYVCKRRWYKPSMAASPDVPDSRGDIFKNLLRIGIPIALSSIVLSIINLIDSSLCMARLQSAAGFTYVDAKILYGVYGKAQYIFNVPAAFITPLTISIVPAIAGQVVLGNKDEAGKISEDSLRISMALSLPMGVGLAVIAEPAMKVLYPGSNEAGPVLLGVLGIASIFVCFSLMTTAVLQASGREKLTAVSIITGGIVKVIVNYFLVAIPSVNIYGAPVGTLCCYVTMCIMNVIFIFRSFDKAPSLKNICVRPVISAAIMGIVASVCYSGLGNVLDYGSRIQMAAGMCAAILAAAVVYTVSAIVLKAITAEDMKLIPKGEKVAKLLHMR